MPSRQNSSEYKPLTFSTTVRNPSRIKEVLNIISKFEGQILTNALSIEIFKNVIKEKKYQVISAWSNPITRHLKSKYSSEDVFTDNEVELIMENNPQNHKQRDFQHGYPSRFQTFFDIHRQFGFFYYSRPGMNDELAEEIKISDLGKKLLLCDQDNVGAFDTSELETNIFAHALTKHHGDNPFIKRKNKNIPLILLAKVIKLLNADDELIGKGKGISKKEIALLLVWRDDDADSLYKLIKKIRLENRYPISDEVILDACDSYQPRWASWQDHTMLIDIPDDFIRKMRITGLFSLRGGGRYLDINKIKQDKLDYILSSYLECRSFSSELDYFNYSSEIDENILNLEEDLILIGDDYKLDYWVQHYSWESVKKEIESFSNKSGCKDPILKLMDRPVRSEFLCTLALKHQLKNVEILPRYKIDDEGIPYTHAPGNGPDIECTTSEASVLLEVTLHTSGQQLTFEGPQTKRHLENYKSLNPSKITSCWFVAPQIHQDFLAWAEFQISVKENHYLALSFDQFISKIKSSNTI